MLLDYPSLTDPNPKQTYTRITTASTRTNMPKGSFKQYMRKEKRNRAPTQYSAYQTERMNRYGGNDAIPETESVTFADAQGSWSATRTPREFLDEIVHKHMSNDVLVLTLSKDRTSRRLKPKLDIKIWQQDGTNGCAAETLAIVNTVRRRWEHAKSLLSTSTSGNADVEVLWADELRNHLLSSHVLQTEQVVAMTDSMYERVYSIRYDVPPESHQEAEGQGQIHQGGYDQGGQSTAYYGDQAPPQYPTGGYPSYNGLPVSSTTTLAYPSVSSTTLAYPSSSTTTLANPSFANFSRHLPPRHDPSTDYTGPPLSHQNYNTDYQAYDPNYQEQ